MQLAVFTGQAPFTGSSVREVLEHVVTGKLNKQIADHLGVVEKTIKVHRARVMQKMKVRSLAELVRLAGGCGIKGSSQL